MHFCSQPALLGQKLQFLIFQRITENIPKGIGRTPMSASAKPCSSGHSTSQCRISSGVSSVSADFGNIINPSSVNKLAKIMPGLHQAEPAYLSRWRRYYLCNTGNKAGLYSQLLERAMKKTKFWRKEIDYFLVASSSGFHLLKILASIFRLRVSA
jgi:hypothetical protein